MTENTEEQKPDFFASMDGMTSDERRELITQVAAQIHDGSSVEETTEETDEETEETAVVVEAEKIVPTFTLELTREAQRTLQDSKVKESIAYVIERILAGGRQKIWEVTWLKETPIYNGGRRTTLYKVIITLKPKNYVEGRTEQHFESVKEYAEDAARGQKWDLVKYGDEILVTDKASSKLIIPTDWYDGWFRHIYSREPQIQILMSAVRAGIQSEFNNRFHCVLYGPPACGKTEITRTFKEMFGDEAVLEYDATSTTQAGAIKDLANREVIPQLLIVEEIEKTDENSLRWLLSVLDHRAEIRKTNYRESVQREVKLLCIATVNDFALFQKLMYGALASRFAHKIYCPRPDEAILTKILTREIERVEGGRLQWIKPAIKYALAHDMNDPRQVTAICLSGGDQLLDGSYQEMLRSCAGPESIEDMYTPAIPDVETPPAVLAHNGAGTRIKTNFPG